MHTEAIKYPIGEARALLSELVSKVCYQKQRVVLTRNGKEVAVVVPIGDFELLSELENRLDFEKALEALKHTSAEESLDWDEFKKELL